MFIYFELEELTLSSTSALSLFSFIPFTFNPDFPFSFFIQILFSSKIRLWYKI